MYFGIIPPEQFEEYYGVNLDDYYEDDDEDDDEYVVNNSGNVINIIDQIEDLLNEQPIIIRRYITQLAQHIPLANIINNYYLDENYFRSQHWTLNAITRLYGDIEYLLDSITQRFRTPPSPPRNRKRPREPDSDSGSGFESGRISYNSSRRLF